MKPDTYVDINDAEQSSPWQLNLFNWLSFPPLKPSLNPFVFQHLNWISQSKLFWCIFWVGYPKTLTLRLIRIGIWSQTTLNCASPPTGLKLSVLCMDVMVPSHSTNTTNWIETIMYVHISSVASSWFSLSKLKILRHEKRGVSLIQERGRGEGQGNTEWGAKGKYFVLFC